MPAQNHRVIPVTKDAPFPIECRDYVPGPDRRAMAAIIPPDRCTEVVGVWRRAANDQLELVVGIPGTDSQQQPCPSEIRLFPTLKQRQQAQQVHPSPPPPLHRVGWWWDPSPADEDAETKVCTLREGVIPDHGAAKPASGDGLDELDETKLLTIAGVEQAKDSSGKAVKRGALTGEIIACIRANRIKKGAKS